MSDPIAFRLDAATYDLLRKFAKENGLSVGEASRFLVETALKRDPDQAAASTAIWRVQRNMRQGLSRVTARVAETLRQELVKPFEDAAPDSFEYETPEDVVEESIDEETFDAGPEELVDEDEEIEEGVTTPLEGARRRRRRGRRGGR